MIGQELEWLDGDLTTVVESEGSEEPRRGRGRGKPERAGRGRAGDDKRGRRDRGPRAEPVEETAGETDAQQTPPKRERPSREAAKPREERAPVNARNDNAPRRDAEMSQRHDRPRRHRQDDDLNDGTVGFGDEVPAFMKVIAKV